MSFGADQREESFIEIPANTQHDFARALVALQRVHPEMFGEVVCQTSLWERNFTMKPEGGAFLARAIEAAIKSDTAQTGEA